MLGAEKGSEIELVACGGDEERSLRAITDFFENGSGI
jgi:phosphotransferase system HPr-like phosphotransfer protein